MRALLLSLLALGCGKQLNPEFCAAHRDDLRCEGDTAAPDADMPDGLRPDDPMDVAHLPDDVESQLTSTAALTFDTTTFVDTSSGTFTPALPGDVVILSAVLQENGPPVLVVQARSIAVNAAVYVGGDKPIIFVATETIDVVDRIEASAYMQLPGAGGGAPGQGVGAGKRGMSSGMSDAGGGGGSFGASGGHAGNVGPIGGAPAGVVYGAASTLIGGSGGGAPAHPGTSCMPRGGAGGGAIQLTAYASITIDGSVAAGGGGGKGGEGCGSDGAGGAGGGSGGMVYVQAPMLLGAGSLAANGGGGGEGASTSGGNNGVDGKDASTGGAGGTSGNSGGDGGAGASGTTAAGAGADVSADGNSGGGGGGAGRIYLHTSGSAPSYTTSPPGVSAIP